MTSQQVGTKFKVYSTEYVVDAVRPIDASLTALIELFRSTKKQPFFFDCSLVLKSGKRSKRGGTFIYSEKTKQFHQLN